MYVYVHVYVWRGSRRTRCALQCVAMFCSVLQCDTLSSGVLQCVASIRFADSTPLCEAQLADAIGKHTSTNMYDAHLFDSGEFSALRCLRQAPLNIQTTCFRWVMWCTWMSRTCWRRSHVESWHACVTWLIQMCHVINAYICVTWLIHT